MKKTAQSLALGSILGILAVFFIASPAHAQSGHFVLSSQGVLSETATFSNGNSRFAIWHYRLGSGLSGTTTGAFLDADFTVIRANGQYGYITLTGYSDSSYSSPISSCTYSTQSLALQSYFRTSPVQLALSTSSGLSPCAFLSSDFYDVTVEWDGAHGGATGDYVDSSNITFSGSSATTTFLYSSSYSNVSTNVVSGYYALVGDNFFITPTTTDSGVFFSGAQSFCNDAFASSTGIGATFGNGLCIALGYLFVPTPDSVQAFPNLFTQISVKAPFSWVFQTVSTWQGLTASSTQNLPTYTANTSQFDFSSSTALGSILPSSLSLLSTTTIGTYLPAGIHDSLYTLAEFAIALSAVGYMFTAGRNLLKT